MSVSLNAVYIIVAKDCGCKCLKDLIVTHFFLFYHPGTKHKTMLEARSGVGSIKSFPRPGVKSKLAPPTKAATGLQNKTFHCEICDVHVNSETQLKQVSYTRVLHEH